MKQEVSPVVFFAIIAAIVLAVGLLVWRTLFASNTGGDDATPAAKHG